MCKLPYVQMLKFLGKLEFTCDFWSAALALYCKRFEACFHSMQGSLRKRRHPKRKLENLSRAGSSRIRAGSKKNTERNRMGRCQENESDLLETEGPPLSSTRC